MPAVGAIVCVHSSEPWLGKVTSVAVDSTATVYQVRPLASNGYGSYYTHLLHPTLVTFDGYRCLDCGEGIIR